MNQNMIGRMAVIAAITLVATTLAATGMVTSLTQQAFAQSTASGSNSAEFSATQSPPDCASTGTGPLTLLSITVCKQQTTQSISQFACQDAAAIAAGDNSTNTNDQTATCSSQ